MEKKFLPRNGATGDAPKIDQEVVPSSPDPPYSASSFFVAYGDYIVEVTPDDTIIPCDENWCPILDT